MSRATGSIPTDTPTCVLAAARNLPGWALSYHKTERQADGTLLITVRLSHRGAFGVSHQPFKQLRHYHALKVHSFVAGQKASIWLTLRPV